jgi:hypothetical protein
MDFFVAAALAVVGAAFIVGGIVGYRKSEGATGKAVSAGAIAAGIVMWAVIIFITPVTRVVGP